MISFIAHILSYFRGNLSPHRGLCISRVIGVMAVWPWLRSPVYCGQNVNAFAEAEVRAVLINSLSSEVIQPLIDLKVRSLSFVRSVSYLSLKCRHGDRRPTSGQGSVSKRTSNPPHSSTMTMLRTRYPASDEITGADVSTLRTIGKQWHPLLQQSLQRVPPYRHPFLSMLPTRAQ